MSQSAETTPVTSKESVLSFLSALKSDTKAQGGESGLFASLLSETKSVPVEAKAPERTIDIERPSTRQAQNEMQDNRSVQHDEGQAQQRTETKGAVQNDDGKKASDSKAADAKPVDTKEAPVAEKASKEEAVDSEDMTDIAEDGVAMQAAAVASEDQDSKETSEADAALLAFLASLNPLAETTDMTVAETEKTAEETSEKDLADVASHIEAELKALLGTRKQTSENTDEAADQVAVTDDGEVKATLENALAMKAKQREGQEGKAVTATEETEIVEEGDEFSTLAGRAVDGKEKDPYAKETSADAKKFDFDEAFLPRKDAKAEAPQQSLAASAGDNLKKALDNLTSANNNSKPNAVGESSQNNNLGTGVRSADSYSFSSQLSAVRVTKGGNAGLPTPAEQIAVQVNKMAKAGKDEMTINLKPAELGKVQIKLEFGADQKVQALVMADNQSSLDLLMKDQDSLQRALESAGMKLDSGSMQFSLNEDNQDKNFEQERMAQNGGDQDNHLADGEVEVAEEEVETYYVTPGRVNFRV